jgi:hypothetical protein
MLDRGEGEILEDFFLRVRDMGELLEHELICQLSVSFLHDPEGKTIATAVFKGNTLFNL